MPPVQDAVQGMLMAATKSGSRLPSILCHKTGFVDTLADMGKRTFFDALSDETRNEYSQRLTGVATAQRRRISNVKDELEDEMYQAALFASMTDSVIMQSEEVMGRENWPICWICSTSFHPDIKFGLEKKWECPHQCCGRLACREAMLCRWIDVRGELIDMENKVRT